MIQYGSAVGSRFQMRVGVDIVSQAKASPTGAAVSVRLMGWFSVRTVDNNNTLSWTVRAGGQTITSGSRSASINGSGEMQLHAFSFTVPASTRIPLDFQVTASLTRVENVGLSTVASVTRTGRIAWNAPAAPTNAAVARASDTRQNVTWKTVDSGAAKVESVVVSRREEPSGAWVNVGTVSPAANLFGDTSTVADRLYRYGVTATNRDGSSNRVTTGTVATSPAPATVSLEKGASGIINVSITPKSRISGVRHELWAVTNGVRGAAPLTTLAAGQTTWRWTANPAQRQAIQARAIITSNAGVLAGSYGTTSNELLMESPPLAPTNLLPAVADPALPIELRWHHNPVDGTAQSAYELRYRINGAETNIGKVESSEQRHTLPAFTLALGTATEREVRTWGVHADPSPWSATAPIQLGTSPVATILSPADSIPSNRVSVELEYHQADDEDMTGSRVRVYRDDVLLEQREGTGLSYLLSTEFEDGATYRIEAEVRSAIGLWSQTDIAELPVHYQPPVRAQGVITWDISTGSVAIDVATPAAGEGEIPAEVTRVYRANGDLLGELPGLSGIVIDPLPITGRSSSYALETEASSGARAVTIVEAFPPPVVQQRLWLNYGDELADVVWLVGNPSLSVDTPADVVAYHFDGRPQRVAYFGDSSTFDLDVAARLITAHFSPVAFEHLHGLGWWRDPVGRSIKVAIQGSKITQTRDGYCEVALDLMDVDDTPLDASLLPEIPSDGWA